ncbi:MAG: hypothetical protein ACFB0B_07420 [Thermonemataceae bacterium]
MNNILKILFLLSLTGCNLQMNPQGERPTYYFDLKGFIATQVTYLNEANPTVSKRVVINKKVQRKEISQVNWQKELDLFNQADINKSSLKDMYEESERQIKGQRVVTYKAKRKSLYTQVLKVVFESSSNTIIRIEAKMNAQNYLYCTYRHITLYCTPSKEGKVRLKAYGFEGKQQMILAGREDFEVYGKIL